MNELALFAGGGGGILGGALLGWNTVGAVEIEESARGMLLARQRDGVLPHFPIWDDVCSFDGRPWRGLVDVISGGFPCQDISCAGKGEGIGGARSGLWAEMHRIVREVRPRFVLVENSPMLTLRGLHRVLGDLAESGYDAAWCVLGAADVGAPHRRNRIWILALDTDTDRVQCPEQRCEHEGSEGYHGGGSEQLEARGGVANTAGERLEEVEVHPGGSAGADGDAPDWASRGGVQSPLLPDTDMSGREEQRRCEPAGEEYSTAECGGWWSAEPSMGRVAHGVAHRVDRLKALGNGQVPLVAASAFRFLEKILLSSDGSVD